MPRVAFNTTNQGKLASARAVCAEYGLEILPLSLEVDEIQGEDAERIALDKAARVFEKAGQPVIVSDDSWAIPGLNGFPGVYMHSINHWFSAEDFLRLTSPLQDRRIFFTKILVYIDKTGPKLFKDVSVGEILTESRGRSPYVSLTITAMEGDGGLTIAEIDERADKLAGRRVVRIWHEFAAWKTGRPSLMK